jgi:hypothetical protein
MSADIGGKGRLTLPDHEVDPHKNQIFRHGQPLHPRISKAPATQERAHTQIMVKIVAALVSKHKNQPKRTKRVCSRRGRSPCQSAILKSVQNQRVDNDVKAAAGECESRKSRQ